MSEPISAVLVGSTGLVVRPPTLPPRISLTDPFYNHTKHSAANPLGIPNPPPPRNPPINNHARPRPSPPPNLPLPTLNLDPNPTHLNRPAILAQHTLNPHSPTLNPPLRPRHDAKRSRFRIRTVRNRPRPEPLPRAIRAECRRESLRAHIN